jgi:cytoskeletal protein RodZ
MRDLGEYLQAERLARGVSLEEIASNTKVSLNMLRAIEAGEVERLPAPVLVKGFLRAYARQLGLDPEAVVLKYQDLVEEESAREEALEKFHHRFRSKPSGKKGVVLLCGLIVLLGFAVFLLWPDRERQPVPATGSAERSVAPEATQRTAPGAPTSDQHAEPSASSEVAEPSRRQSPVPAPVAPAPEVPQQERPSSAPQRDAGTPPEVPRQTETPAPGVPTYVLRAETVEPTWLQIVIDDIREREYLLQPGDRVRWQASSGFELHIGNAAGLNLYLNDKPLKSLGDRGQVVHLELPDPDLVVSSES